MEKNFIRPSISFRSFPCIPHDESIGTSLRAMDNLSMRSLGKDQYLARPSELLLLELLLCIAVPFSVLKLLPCVPDTQKQMILCLHVILSKGKHYKYLKIKHNSIQCQCCFLLTPGSPSSRGNPLFHIQPWKILIFFEY